MSAAQKKAKSKPAKVAEKKTQRRDPEPARQAALKTAKDALGKPLLANADEKGVMKVSRNVVATRDMLQAAIGKNAISTRIFAVGSSADSGAGSAVATVYQANMASTGEWTTFQSLFDECRCTDVVATWFVTPATAPGSQPLGVMVWDADDLTALSTVQLGMPFTRRAGPYLLKATDFSLPAAAHRRQGFQLSSGPLARSGFPAESSGTPVAYPVRGDWVATSSSTAIVGFVKTYIEAVTSLVWTTRMVLEYHVEYRMRS